MKRIILFSCVLLLSSCTTTLTQYVIRPPYMNTSGITKIAIKPFDINYSSGYIESRLDRSELISRISGTIIEEFKKRIEKTGHFEIISIGELNKLKYNNAEELNTIAYFTGQVETMAVRFNIRKNGAGIEKPYWDTRLQFTYRLLKASDNKILGERTVSSSASNEQFFERKDFMGRYEPNNNEGYMYASNCVPRAFTEVSLFPYFVRSFDMDIIPWTIKEKRKLISNRTGDKREDDAIAHLKNGSYRSAISLLKTLFEETENFSIGYNLSIAYDLSGDLNEALFIMQKIHDEANNPKDKKIAENELNRIKQYIGIKEVLSSDYNMKNDNSITTVINKIFNELKNNLPNDKVFSTVNISNSSVELAEFVTEEINVLLINDKSFTAVERKNLNVIRAEQQLQLSGDVSDESIVSIGNFLGAEIIIACEITGFDELRRIRIKALDVLTGVILFQMSERI